MWVCSVSYPSCNARAPYCSMWPVRQYHILPHSHIRHDFLGKKKWLNAEQFFRHNFCLKHLILRKIQLDKHRHSHRLPDIFARVLWNLYFFDRFGQHNGVVFIKLISVFTSWTTKHQEYSYIHLFTATCFVRLLQQSFRPPYAPGFDSASNRNEHQKYFPGGKCRRCVGLTTLPPSCADCLEIWEPQPHETIRACPGLYSYSFTFTTAIIRQFHN